MANWLEKLRTKREVRVSAGQPLSDAERDRYRKAWGKTARAVGVMIAKMTGRKEARTIAERTGETYGEHVAKQMDRRIAERNRFETPDK
jgi:hypothetical protein